MCAPVKDSAWSGLWKLRLLHYLCLFSCLVRIYPDYYLEIKRPMSLMKIHKKLKVGSLLFSHYLSAKPLLFVKFVVSHVLFHFYFIHILIICFC